MKIQMYIRRCRQCTLIQSFSPPLNAFHRLLSPSIASHSPTYLLKYTQDPFRAHKTNAELPGHFICTQEGARRQCLEDIHSPLRAAKNNPRIRINAKHHRTWDYTSRPPVSFRLTAPLPSTMAACANIVNSPNFNVQFSPLSREL